LIKLTLYTKPKCHLCDVMKEELMRYDSIYEIEVSEINIENDEELSAKYGEKIPVLIYDGRMICKYRHDKYKFDRFCKSVQDK
jgi:glutaredoxin